MSEMEIGIKTFWQGDFVMYKANGICEIVEIRRENFDGVGVQDYYKLRSVFEPRMQMFVPCNSELSARMRAVILPEEVDGVIESALNDPVKWVDDPKKRLSEYTEILMETDKARTLSLYLLLSSKKEELESQKKRLYTNDARVLAKAQKNITEEFSFVLGMPRDNIAAYISEKVKDLSALEA